MKKIIAYIILLLILLVLSPGIETMQMLLEDGGDFASVWVMFLPSTIMYLFLFLIINNRWLIPRYLLRGQYAKYIFFATLFLIVISLLIALLETWTQQQFDLPTRRKINSAFWLLADTMSNVLFWVPLMISLTLLKLYSSWKEDLKREHALSISLQQYMENVRFRLNSKVIFSKLREISSAIHTNAEVATDLINRLSDYLRSQLSEMPSPPQFKDSEYDKSLFSGLTSFLVNQQFSWLRHLLLILELIAVSVIAYGHEYAQDIKAGAVQSIVLFIFLITITYIEILLFRRFAKYNNFKKFAWSMVAVLLIFNLPLLLTLVCTGNAAADESILPKILEVAAVAAGVMAVTLYVVGLSSLLFFQNWIKAKRHIILLRSETLRQEYLFLRKQINPHFLFNVLNNIEISAYDDPNLASALLHDLTILLQYQFEEGKKEKTSLKKEVEFLRSYLTLEQSRRDNFSFDILMEESIGSCLIPTLMLIPIVENAAKYSPRSQQSGINVIAQFKATDKWLIFKCQNPFEQDSMARKAHHGIGLENVRRRLEIIYDGDAEMDIEKSDHLYSVEISFPLDNTHLNHTKK